MNVEVSRNSSTGPIAGQGTSGSGAKDLGGQIDSIISSLRAMFAGNQKSEGRGGNGSEGGRAAEGGRGVEGDNDVDGGSGSGGSDGVKGSEGGKEAGGEKGDGGAQGSKGAEDDKRAEGRKSAGGSRGAEGGQGTELSGRAGQKGITGEMETLLQMLMALLGNDEVSAEDKGKIMDFLRELKSMAEESGNTTLQNDLNDVLEGGLEMLKRDKDISPGDLMNFEELVNSSASGPQKSQVDSLIAQASGMMSSTSYG